MTQPADTAPTDSAPRRLREAKRQARSFERARQAHQREVAEDYVELIADLIDVTGEARAVDLAERLGVTNATVNNALNRLTREGLVTRQRYRSIFLTDTGRALAETARERHRLVRDFLVSLGVDPETAEIDAEGIEHHTSEKTLAALRRFLGR
jgi:DtxR family manganese transport transcriptional regulator